MNWLCQAQEKELRAGIEMNDGSSEEGYILIRSPNIYHELISFRKDVNSNYQEYYPKHLKSYTIAEDVYESHAIDSSWHFFLVILKGEASLYELSTQQKRYYIQMQGEDKIYWLRHEKMVIPNEGSQKTVKLVSYYKEILTKKLLGCSSLDSLQLPNPTEKELKAYVSNYNKCFSGNNYEQRELKKQLFLGVSSGMSFSNNNYFSMGATLDFKNQRKKLLLTSFSYKYSQWEYVDNADRIIDQSHCITYQVNLILFANKRIEPFVLFEPGMGLVSEFTQGKENKKKYFFLQSWSGAGLKINFNKNGD